MLITRGILQDIHYSFCNNNEEIIKKAIQAYLKAIKTHGIDNVTLITPMRKNEGLTVNTLNRKIQNELIPGGKEIKFGDAIFREGSKVIQRENDYTGKGVINGEIGYIKTINQDRSFVVEFRDKTIDYSKDEVRQIELAYAITGHSYQGSQAKIVIIAFSESSYIMLSRQWLYTAITRAQKICYIITTKKAYNISISRNITKRRTFLQKLLGSLKVLLTL